MTKKNHILNGGLGGESFPVTFLKYPLGGSKRHNNFQ